MTSGRVAPLTCVRVDGDDFSEVMVEVERSFGISLPRDLTHVSTVGDLFEVVLAAGNPDGRGERCDTAMAFYRLRRMLVSFGLHSTAGPKTALARRRLPSPRKVRQLFRAELGLESPGIVVSRTACTLAIAIVVATVGWALAARSFDALGLWLLVLPVFALDRGSWKGEWETLGSLSRAIAIRNVSTFAHQGARNGEAEWWRSFSHLIATTVFDEHNGAVEHDQLRRATRFAFS